MEGKMEQTLVNILLILCGIFYSVLCIFSIVTGLMYASGKKELNPLELSDEFMSLYTDQDKLKRFTIKMGWVTFLVGIVQGITAFAILHRLCCMEAKGKDQCLPCYEMHCICCDSHDTSPQWIKIAILHVLR